MPCIIVIVIVVLIVYFTVKENQKQNDEKALKEAQFLSMEERLHEMQTLVRGGPDGKASLTDRLSALEKKIDGLEEAIKAGGAALVAPGGEEPAVEESPPVSIEAEASAGEPSPLEPAGEAIPSAVTAPLPHGPAGPEGEWPETLPISPGEGKDAPRVSRHVKEWLEGKPAAGPEPLIPVPPKAVEEYSEKASRFEMDLAANWLNIAGIISIMAGAIYFLREAMTAASRGNIPLGLPQVILGILLSAGLIFMGDRFHRKDMKSLGHSLISGGFCIMFFTLNAAFFYFHLIKSPAVLGFFIFLVTAASGFTIFYYDSKIIANAFLLVALFTPFLMKFRFENLHYLYFYLIAINLAVAIVAYYKKWDYYVMAPFLLTYAHYFYNYRLAVADDSRTLAFLTLFYAVFLVSNNLFHFRRKEAGGFNLFVSYFNPLLYGCVSYYLLARSHDSLAFALYAVLGVIHLCLAARARHLERENPGFEAITRTNLVLGLMFVTSAISFVTYFTNLDDRYFSLVTLLYFIEAFTLLLLSFRLDFCSRIMRRFSSLTLAIIWAQLVSVVSWMPQDTSGQMIHKFSIYFASMILFYAYFHVMHRQEQHLDGEDRAIMAASLLSVFALVIYLSHGFYNAYSLLLLLAGMAYVILYLSFRFEKSLGFFKYISYGVFSVIMFAAVSMEIYHYQAAGISPDEALRQKAVIYALLALIYCLKFYTIKSYDSHIPEGENFMFLFTALAPAVLTLMALHPFLAPLAFLLVAAFVGNVLLLARRWYPSRLGGMEKVYYAAACAITLIVLFREYDVVKVSFFNHRFPALLGIAFMMAVGWNILERAWKLSGKSDTSPALFMFAIISAILMKAFYLEKAGPVSSLFFAFTGLGVMYAGQEKLKKAELGHLAHVILFIALIKSLMDGSVTEVSLGRSLPAGTLPYVPSLDIAYDVFITVIIGTIYYLAARLSSRDPRQRDVFQAYSLIVFAFQLSAILFKVYGLLDNFQVVLTVFWSATSLLCIVIGITVGRKVFRLFGIVLLVASVLKVVFVDIRVLGFSFMTPILFIVGAILLTTSFLYQRNRAMLTGEPSSGGEAIHLENGE